MKVREQVECIIENTGYEVEKIEIKEKYPKLDSPSHFPDFMYIFRPAAEERLKEAGKTL